MGSYFEFLRDVYFFKDLTDEDVQYIEHYAHTEVHHAQRILFNENDAAEKFYVVMAGSVEIWKNHGSPEQVLLAVQGRGHIFGEMALVDDLDRSATVITHEPSEFVTFEHEDFERIMHQRPNVTLSILRSLSAMVRRSNDLFIQNLSHQNRQLQIAYKELQEAQEELLRAERFSSLGKFASFILHDLRNPIAMIRGYAEMIYVEMPKDDPISDFSRKIIHEADHVNRFANEILDYSRGEIRLNYVLTTVDALFNKARSYLHEAFAKKSIELKFDNLCRNPLMIDEERMLRVLINVADNARKATDAGGAVVFRAENAGERVTIKVVDNGEGMTTEVRERVFEPFYSSSKKGGTGLGMLVVKNVVEAHQGKIEIESEPGKGTHIIISLPKQPDSV